MITVVKCYVDEYLLRLWVNKNPQDTICAKIRTGFVVTISNLPLLCVSKLQTDISLYTLQYEHVALSHYFRDLLPLENIFKEGVDNLVINSDNMDFVLCSTVYEKNSGAIFSGRRKQYVIWNIEYKNQKSNISKKGFKGDMFFSIRKLLRGWKYFR